MVDGSPPEKTLFLFSKKFKVLKNYFLTLDSDMKIAHQPYAANLTSAIQTPGKSLKLDCDVEICLEINKKQKHKLQQNEFLTYNTEKHCNKQKNEIS